MAATQYSVLARFIPIILLGVAALAAANEAMAYDSAYPKTPAGEVQIRTLPGGRWLTTATDGGYFDRSGTLFRRLFNYIKARDVSMTVPVEGAVKRAEMRFFADIDASGSLPSTDTVQVVDVPPRQVASIGDRGAYSESNINEALRRLEAWLDAQDQWAAAGEPYAVFWNGPFTPWFMKRFEVHIPVETAAAR